MRRFLIRILLFVSVPVAILALLYCITDPYKTLKPFSLDYFDVMNRDYLSTELFLMNYPEQRYDSYIFGSSRGCGINTYHWKEYLPEGSNQFLFQAWYETLTGIEQKIDYIDSHGYELRNAIILIDVPTTFDKNQLPTTAIAIKDPAISGQPRWLHQLILYFDYVQKPSQWIISIRCFFQPLSQKVGFDVVSNDWDQNNRYLDLTCPPRKDSLKNMSILSREAFLKTIRDKIGGEPEISEPLLHAKSIEQLKHIKEVFERKGTDYRIAITPGYCYSYPAISPEDELLLKQIFGDNNVINFSGKNNLTTDYNNYSDSGHFGLYVGWYMIEEMYNAVDF